MNWNLILIFRCSESGTTYFAKFSQKKFLQIAATLFLYIRNYTSVRTVLWYPNKLCYFLRLSLNFLTLVVIISISKYLPISTKFDTNIPQCNQHQVWYKYSSMDGFYGFYSLFCFLWDSANFLKWNLYHIKNQFLWCLWGNWAILRLFY